MKAKDVIRTPDMTELDQRLRRVYGEPEPLSGDPLEELVYTILSQSTNDKNAARAYEAMREHFPTWGDVMRARGSVLTSVLKPGGLANTKARYIQKALRRLMSNGNLSLDYLKGMTVEEAEKTLLGFEGVGLKTARCVLLFALGRDVFPVDTHIQRILKRLGVVPSTMTSEEVHRYIQPRIPVGACLSLHINLIAHGRRVCLARAPKCEGCVLADRCAAFREGML